MNSSVPDGYCDSESVEGGIDAGCVEGDVSTEADKRVGPEHQGRVRGRGAHSHIRAVILIQVPTSGK